MCQRLAASHEADPERARDLAQDILVAVWRAWPAFRRQCSERTYVARIAQYRIATHISRAVREPALAPLSEELVAVGPTPEDAAIRTRPARAPDGAGAQPADRAARGGGADARRIRARRDRRHAGHHAPTRWRSAARARAKLLRASHGEFQ